MRTNTKIQTSLVLLALALCTIVIYWPGLDGPFVFDDVVHIAKNDSVQITSLDFASLQRAWQSSPAKFPSNRPLSQLSFGITHALFGPSPAAFKAGNLTVHLTCGLLVYLLAFRLGRFLETQGLIAANHYVYRMALATTTFWLLAPINLTPVLYAVQRMAGLSTFFVLLALVLYVEGRWRALSGGRSWHWLLASFAAASLGALAKENAVLFPVFLLVLEGTILRTAKSRIDNARRAVLAIALLVLGVGALYLATHPHMLSFAGRPFSLEERLLTQARVLWLYVHMILAPRPELFGFYHDDFTISRTFNAPWTTLPAVLGIVAATAGSLVAAKRFPVLAFAVLFFLSGHLIESTVFPLELVFEHRNYLPALGLLFGLAYLLTATRRLRVVNASLVAIAVALSSVYGVLTHLRARDWSSMDRLVMAQVQNHPTSPRANFHAAQLLINWLPASENPRKTYQTARTLLDRMRRIDPENLNAIFGLIFLNLQIGRGPEPEWIATLETKLGRGLVGPTKFTTSQFSALVKWQIDGGYALSEHIMHKLFKAALNNPRFNHIARAGIVSAYRAYLDRVLGRPAEALTYAEQAVDLWPERWHYHRRLVEVLLKLNRVDQAEAALQRAISYDAHGAHHQLTIQLRAALEAAREKQEATS